MFAADCGLVRGEDGCRLGLKKRCGLGDAHSRASNGQASHRSNWPEFVPSVISSARQASPRPTVPMSVLFSCLLPQMCGCDPKMRNQGALPQMSRSLPNGLHAARNDLASCLTIRSPLEEQGFSKGFSSFLGQSFSCTIPGHRGRWGSGSRCSAS